MFVLCYRKTRRFGPKGRLYSAANETPNEPHADQGAHTQDVEEDLILVGASLNESHYGVREAQGVGEVEEAFLGVLEGGPESRRRIKGRVRCTSYST